MRGGPAFCAHSIAFLLLTAASSPALAQDAQREEEIIVTGQRELLGVPVERLLTADDLAAYGLGNIGELLEEIASETGERDEPVFLVNGERVADLDDVEDFPAEAVARIEVLPAGAAARVGASPNRRVYNVVLRRRFGSIVAGASVRVATEGDWSGKRGDLGYSRLRGSRRINLTAKINSEDRLLESERDVEQLPDAIPDAGRFRSLRPDFDSVNLKASVADRLGSSLTGSLSARLSRSTRESLLGLPNAFNPAASFAIEQRGRTSAGNLNLSLNADVGSWLVSLLGTYDHERRSTRTDRQDPGEPLAIGQSRTTAVTTAADAELIAAGPLLDVPAGSIQGTFGAVLSRDSVSGSRRFLNDRTSERYVQWSRDLSAGIRVPLASRANGFLPTLGELSAGAQLNLYRVSDFGTYANRTFSLNWQPAEWVRLFGSVTSGETPPAVGFVADPVLETPGVPYFDPLLGESVDVLQISGGNPDLGSQRNEGRRLSLNVKPVRSLALQLFADYRAVRNRDVITALPAASELVLRAFPDRFIRDSDGNLEIVDIRPVAFARQSEEEVRYGLNLTLPLGAGSGGSTGQDGLQGGSAEDDGPGVLQGGASRAIGQAAFTDQCLAHLAARERAPDRLRN